MDAIDKFFINKVDGSIVYPSKIVTALSGGSDSMALTLLMNEWCNKHSVKLIALVVDHKLRPESKIEAKIVKSKMDNLGIDCNILSYTGDIPKSNIEEIARNYRYNLIIDFCKTNNINYVATGHNKNEQCETFLLNLVRGSGVYGLCGIPETIYKNGINFIRPLLNYTKDELREICIKNGQTWIEDPSNKDDKYLRVRIRKMMDVFLSLGLDENRICKTINNMKSSRETIEKFVQLKLKECVIKIYDKLKIIELDLDILLSSPDEIIYRILEKSIINVSGNLNKHTRSEIICNLIDKLKISLKNKVFNDTIINGTKLKILNCINKSILQISKV